MPPDWWWPMPFFGMLMMPVMLVVAFVIVVPLMRSLGMGPPWWHSGAHGPPLGPSRTALDILNERFARGEIDQAEYEEKRRLLTSR